MGLPAVVAGIAALGVETTHAMRDKDTPKKTLRRQRRANRAGRTFRHEVWMTAEERSLLSAMAEQQGVTVPRLLVESALAGRDTPAGRREALRRVFAMQRTLTGMATNINQLARAANVHGQAPVGTAQALEDLHVAVGELNGLLEELGGA